MFWKISCLNLQKLVIAYVSSKILCHLIEPNVPRSGTKRLASIITGSQLFELSFLKIYLRQTWLQKARSFGPI
jgi:hypothetical protein